jgi:transcriptional regulator with XRE-family HTH domain
MSTKMDDPTPRIAARLKEEREARGWSLGDLADRSGVSRAMISKIERGESSPTAMLLGRLSGAFGLTLSAMLARAELQAGRLLRAADQPQWTDPETGYVRRHVSPATDIPIEIVQVDLPAGAELSFPASAYVFGRRLIWVLKGHLTFVEGDVVHEMGVGDCLALGPAMKCTYRCKGPKPCSYVVVLIRQ